MTYSQLVQSLMWAVDNRLYGDVHGARETVKRHVLEAYGNGHLPAKLGKEWCVGFKVHKTFFGVTVYPILVGPKPPSQIRDKYYNQVTFSRGV